MTAIIRPSNSVWLTFDQIDFPDKGRPTNASDVVALVASIRTIGLQVPLTVIERDGRYLLIAGRHRLEALRVIGEERVPARVVDFDDVEARLWTISENLHRTELTVIQRSEQIAEWIRLMEAKQPERLPGQVAQPVLPDGRKAGPQHQPSGISKAARELPIEGKTEEAKRSNVRRALAVDSLSQEAKEAAVALRAAKAPPEAQVEALVPSRENCVPRHAVGERREGPEQPAAKPLRNLEYRSAGELARWIKETTPNDRTRVIRLLRECAANLEDELQAAKAPERASAGHLHLIEEPNKRSANI